ncbi:hypothetical protein M409DRAFT_21087 [Zasmidium cellare ATCC 36951]|uniref:Beta-lactamase-related domain-containing protein n=1 Tax=Zasmidium cellare ATCC 36951 TaxID=1080233 RepID=A0A6A6CUC3_ZASCE|nr:uncharacterized protein M409DRAFT_21087 [Zasmidium cellare ATCC 36951]KAF2169076.1 hypothetical protein M409DRAFT_21087 [Zasmidium cellare ATCC 36951]
MEEAFEKAVESREIPGAALLSTNKSGTFSFAKCFGRRGIDEDEEPLETDTVMRIASATKLLTSVASMQCVERGLLNLDNEISSTVPELGAFQVLTGFGEDGQPILRPPKRPITLRRLLSHSSGLCYDAMHPLLIQYRKWQGIQLQPDFETIAERFTYPLVYDPGDGWSYGPSLEWAGKAVERASGLTLDAYLQHNICTPLDIRDMTFKLQQRPDMIKRRATSCDRDEQGNLTAGDNDFWRKDFEDDFGGMGCFTTPADYFKVMTSLLHDDGKLLKPTTVDMLFERQLGEAGEQGMADVYAHELFGQAMGHLVPKEVNKSHALGGSLMMDDADGSNWRRKGTMVWAGLPNVIWSIDREAGRCCLYASQVRPPGDPPSLRLAELFERSMYSRATG